jgi:hypothetical protein
MVKILIIKSDDSLDIFTIKTLIQFAIDEVDTLIGGMLVVVIAIFL